MPRRPPEPVDPQSLERAALNYLEQRSTSAAWLRRLLVARVRRAARAWGADPAEGERQVDELLARLVASGLLDDAAWAASRARALRRRGASAAVVRARLAEKGLRGEIAADALAEADEGVADPDLTAAARWARAHRLGPWRPEDARAAHRDKDLARMGRRGFPWSVAARVIDAPADEADDLLDPAGVARGPSRG